MPIIRKIVAAPGIGKPYKKSLATIAFYVFFLCCNSAQSVTLEECKALCLRNSNLVKAYENLIQASVSAYRKDMSELFPQISGFYQPNYLVYDKDVDFEQHGLRNTLGGAMTVDIPKILSNYPQLSKLEIQKSGLVKKLAENEVIKNLTQDYYRLYISLQKKRYYSRAQSFVNEHVKELEEMQVKGVDVKLDLIRAHVQLKSLCITMSNINEQIANAVTSLDSLMAAEYTESDFSKMDAPDLAALETGQHIVDENPPGVDPEPSYIERIEEAIPQKITILEQSQLGELDVKLAGEKYRQSKFRYIPSLEGGFEYNNPTIDPSVEIDRTFLTFNVDIFDFGRKANERRLLKYDYESQKMLFEENLRKLKVQIYQLITEIKNIQITYKNSLDNNANAEEALETAREYFQKGKIKETDLLSIFSESLDAKDQCYDILYNFFVKKAELDSLIKGMAE